MAGTQSVDVRETDARSPSRQVIAAVAAEEGVAPVGLETPLFEAIDPEALDSLFEGRSTTAMVEFSYHGYRVTVRNDEPVTVTPLND